MTSVYLAELNQHFPYHQVLLLYFTLRFHKNSPEGKIFIPLKIIQILGASQASKKTWGFSPPPLSIPLEFHLLTNIPTSAQGSASRQCQAAAAPLQGYRIRPGQAESHCQ